MPNIIAITIGDSKGIGIHILIDIWKKNKLNNFILFTNMRAIAAHLIKAKIPKNKLNLIKNNDEFKFIRNKFNICTFDIKSLEDNTLKSLKYAYDSCKNKYCIGIITLPLRKDLIKIKINKRFQGQTEFFQKIDNKKFSNMILYHNKIIISTLTTHIEVNKISNTISNKKFIYNKIYNLNNTLKIDFNIRNPKIIISGLNPHSGENGLVGKEEIDFIKPAINKLRKNGVNINGPISADSILIKKNLKKYDCFLFIYHDQALIPFKYISQFTGVNYTGNLNIIRTSPDHGTAYDLIGKKNISNKSFLNCYKLIKKININRKIHAKTKKIS